jgi:hypothetical protein
MNAIDDATARPTNPQMGRMGELKQETLDAGNLLEKILLQQVAPINDKVKNLPQVVVGKSEKKDM